MDWKGTERCEVYARASGRKTKRMSGDSDSNKNMCDLRAYGKTGKILLRSAHSSRLGPRWTTTLSHECQSGGAQNK